MKKIRSQLVVWSGLVCLAACTTTKKTAIPLSSSAIVEDTYTIIWNGSSEAYRYKDGAWVRDESYDYQFDVVQKRYANTWKSVKSLHRLHPGYDGKAGERDQTLYFEIDYRNLEENRVVSAVRSSLGDGAGATDKEFRKAEIVIYVKNGSAMAPYNKFKITQNYRYEDGLLTETVELLKDKDGKEIPFMKNEEKAYIYIRGKLANAPTVFKE